MICFRKLLRDASDAMFKVYICILIALLSIFNITFSIYFFDKVPLFFDYFKGNLLPEFTGMVLEILLFIFVIDVLRDSERERQEKLKLLAMHKEKVDIERRLRSQLRALVRRVFEEVELNGNVVGLNFKFHASEYEDNQNTLACLRNMLSEELDSTAFAENLINSAQFELPMLLSLASVNSSLSGRHLKAWMCIIFYLKQISENKNNNIKENTEKLIDWIRMFDKVSHNQKLV